MMLVIAETGGIESCSRCTITGFYHQTSRVSHVESYVQIHNARMTLRIRVSYISSRSF
jgi:hypothetical protein